jgi:uncharacterized coiled-coil protein SlyX
MDIARLLEQEAQISADTAAILKGRKATPSDLQRPLDLQQDQLTRVTDRIKALEEEKLALAARIDAQIAELNGERDQRQRALETQREGLKSAMNAVAATGGSDAGKPIVKESPPEGESPRGKRKLPKGTAPTPGEK